MRAFAVSALCGGARWAVRQSCRWALLFVPVLVCAQPGPDRFAPEIEAFEAWDRRNTVPARPVVFVGSSSIRMWNTAEAFPDLPVVNRGFGGSQLADANHYLSRVVLPYAPRAVVLYAGDNDIAAGKTPDEVFADYRVFVERVQAAHPGTPIVFVAIKPSLSRWELWPQMKAANTLVRTHAEQHPHLYYADIAAPMLKATGRPDPAHFVADGLHLSPAGYAEWNRVLTRVLQQALAL